MDIHSVLDRYNVEYDASGRNKNTSGWVNCRCPSCGKWPYLGINKSSLAASCWSCGRMPLAATLIALTGGMPDEIFALIKDIPREDLPLRGPRKRGELKPPMGIGPLADVHCNYLKERNFDPAKIAKIWGVCGVNFLGGSYAWQLYIPVHQHGEVVSFVTRRVDDKEPRYLAAKDSESIVPIKDCLYGCDFARNSCIIVEGCTDCWAIGPGAVATLGLRTTDSQFQALSRFPVRVVLFDAGAAERAARRKAEQLSHELSCFEGKTVQVTLTSGKDAASADPAEIEEIRSKYLLL